MAVWGAISLYSECGRRGECSLGIGPRTCSGTCDPVRCSLWSLAGRAQGTCPDLVHPRVHARRDAGRRLLSPVWKRIGNAGLSLRLCRPALPWSGAARGARTVCRAGDSGCDRNEDVMADLTGRLRAVLDHLIALRDDRSQPGCGLRNLAEAPAALAPAAAEPRVKCVAAFAPVIDLGVLDGVPGGRAAGDRPAPGPQRPGRGTCRPRALP